MRTSAVRILLLALSPFSAVTVCVATWPRREETQRIGSIGDMRAALRQIISRGASASEARRRLEAHGWAYDAPAPFDERLLLAPRCVDPPEMVPEGVDATVCRRTNGWAESPTGRSGRWRSPTLAASSRAL